MSSSTCSSRRPTSRGPSERGVALPGVLLLTAFLVGATGWLVGHRSADLAMSGALEDAHAAARLAEAALQVVAMALGQVDDWTVVDGLMVPLSCPTPTVSLVPLDEDEERRWLQAQTDAGSRWGADTPQWWSLWACHGPGVLGRPGRRGAAPAVIVWVADEPEGDAAPFRSSNQRLLLHAVARAGSEARGAASVTIGRANPGAAVTLTAWRTEPGS